MQFVDHDPFSQRLENPYGRVQSGQIARVLEIELVVIKAVSGADALPWNLVVVQHRTEELKGLAPTP